MVSFDGNKELFRYYYYYYMCKIIMMINTAKSSDMTRAIIWDFPVI